MPVLWQFVGMFSCFLVKYIVLKSTYIMIKFAVQLETKIDTELWSQGKNNSRKGEKELNPNSPLCRLN